MLNLVKKDPVFEKIEKIGIAKMRVYIKNAREACEPPPVKIIPAVTIKRKLSVDAQRERVSLS